MLKEFIIEAYEVFSRRLHNIPQFVFEPSERELKQIENFIDLLEKRYHKSSLGRTFLYNFISFNYEYWSDLDHKAKKRIPLNWIIGKKSIERWVNRTEDDLYHSQKYVSERGIHVGLIKAGTEKRSDDVTQLKRYEETEKKRYHNTGLGMTNCIETTTLYNHRSVHCLSCNKRSQCKKLLKDNYPKIYISRGYLKV